MSLSKLRSIFRIKSPIEKEAEAIWNHGYMTVDYRMPLFGQRWKEEYYPYFRKYAAFPRKVSVWGVHASINDEEFWRNASLHFTPDDYGAALNYGSQYGCTAMFKVFPPPHVKKYVEGIKKKKHLYEERHIVHPDVVGWLRQQKYLNQSDMDALGRNYSFLHQEHSSLKRLPHFLGRSEMLNDWLVSAFAQHQWSADVQAQVIGHTMMTFSGHFLHADDGGQSRIQEHLDPDVDLAMLAAVCGMTPSAFPATGPVDSNKEMDLLYTSIQQISQHCRQHVWGKGNQQPPAIVPALEIKGGHHGLNLLMEFVPPQQPMDLYRAALGVQRHILGQTKVETLELPELGFGS